MVLLCNKGNILLDSKQNWLFNNIQSIKMNNKLTAFSLLLFITVIFSGFYKGEHKPSKGIKFVSFRTTKINDTLVKIDATIDNGERERTFTVNCTLCSDSFLIRTEIAAWFYNYSKTFTASIPIK